MASIGVMRDRDRQRARVVIINDVSVARGGATALALSEVRLMRELGVEVAFATGDAGDNPLFGELGVSVLALGGKRLLEAGKVSYLGGLYNRHTIDVLAPALAASDTPQTVYHVHGWSQILSPSLFAVLAPYRDRVVLSAHDFFLACPNGAYANFRTGRNCELTPLRPACLVTNCDKRSYAHKLWRVGRQLVQARTLRFEEGGPLVLMIHEAMREPLRRAGLPDGCLRALPNPVTPWSDVRIAAETNREFLFVGRFTEEKGPDLAARAARLAGVPMTFIGDGPMLDGLRAAYPEFTFLGRLPPDQIARHAARARALVMPSRYPEPYGLVAVEAMWSGLPALVAQQALLAESIVAHGAGLAFDPRDGTAFAGALRAASDDERARAMSVRAFGATRDFGLASGEWARRLLEVFHSMSAAASPTLPVSLRAAALSPGRVEREDVHIFHGQH